MIRLVVAVALALAGCSSPTAFPLNEGAAEWQTANLCAPDDAEILMQRAIELWSAASPNVRTTVNDGRPCDGVVEWRALQGDWLAATVPGVVMLSPGLREIGDRDQVEIVGHELGHLLVGPAHNPDPESIMFCKSLPAEQRVTATDVARLP